MPLAHAAFAGNTRLEHAARNAPALRRGERGPAVALLQAALVDLGYPMPQSTLKGGVMDGIFGQETVSALRRFQADKKLMFVDGEAGRETLGRLDQLLVAAAKPAPKPAPAPRPVPPSTYEYALGTADPEIRPDPGSGPWKSKPWTHLAVNQRVLMLEHMGKAEIAVGYDAARHLRHYFLMNGMQLTINLEGMLREVPSARRRLEDEVNQARTFVEMLPAGTHAITSRRNNGVNHKEDESMNWYYAVGGYRSWGKGTARVSGAPGSREFELDFEFRFWDRYNWDGKKKVKLFGVIITDHFMGEFHRQGLAREFDMVGAVRRQFRWREGTPIPAEQYQPPSIRG